MAVHTPSTELGRLIGDVLGPLPRVAAESVLLDLERARMCNEDTAGRVMALVERNESLRAASISPIPSLFGDSRLLTWCEWALDRSATCIRMGIRNEDATAALEDALDSVDPIIDDPQANHRESLIRVRDQITDAIELLNPDMYDSDMDDDAQW